MGVASTNNQDQRSSFSNYGNRIVWVAAPGEGHHHHVSLRLVRGRLGHVLQLADGRRDCFAGAEHAAQGHSIAGGLGRGSREMDRLQHGQRAPGRLRHAVNVQPGPRITPVGRARIGNHGDEPYSINGLQDASWNGQHSRRSPSSPPAAPEKFRRLGFPPHCKSSKSRNKYRLCAVR